MKWLDKLKHTPSPAMSAAKDTRNEWRVPYDAILKICELYNSKRKKRNNIVKVQKRMDSVSRLLSCSYVHSQNIKVRNRC